MENTETTQQQFNTDDVTITFNPGKMDHILRNNGCKRTMYELWTLYGLDTSYGLYSTNCKFTPSIIRILPPQVIVQFRLVFRFKRADIHHMKGELNNWLKNYPGFFDYDWKVIYARMNTSRNEYEYINDNPQYGGNLTPERINQILHETEGLRGGIT